MIRHIFAIAKNTFRETMRDRILLAAFVVVLIMFAFSTFIGSISIDQDIRMIVDFGLTVIYLLQIFVAIFIGSMLMHKEIERKTFYLIIPKPVRIESIILGKTLGLIATTASVTMFSTLALYGILFFKNGYSFEHIFFVPILISVFLSIVESAIIIMLSILFSGMTSPILSAIYTIGFFLIGHSSEIIRTLLNETTSQVKIYILQAAYYLLPNLEKFNTRNDVIYEKVPNVSILIVTLLYAFCWIFIIFLLTRFNFKKKEF
jgi:Cu-processing system permease protein